MYFNKRSVSVFLSDEVPMLETLDYAIRIGSTPTFLYFKCILVFYYTYIILY